MSDGVKIGDNVKVLGITGTVSNIRKDDCGGALYTVKTSETPSGHLIARSHEIKKLEMI